MTPSKPTTEDFFDDPPVDPLETAIGGGGSRPRKATTPKKKAGFYLPVDLLNRFNRTYHELILDGYAVDNKSALLEILLNDALDRLTRNGATALKTRLR